MYINCVPLRCLQQLSRHYRKKHFRAAFSVASLLIPVCLADGTANSRAGTPLCSAARRAYIVNPFADMSNLRCPGTGFDLMNKMLKTRLKPAWFL